MNCQLSFLLAVNLLCPVCGGVALHVQDTSEDVL